MTTCERRSPRSCLAATGIEAERFTALRSHYGFDSFFCRPGLIGAHEKGGIEGEIGRFRRTHLVPLPRARDLAQLNAMFAAADAADDRRHLGGRLVTVGEAAAAEVPALRPLPAEPFDAARELRVRVDAKARVCVRQSFYSVPAHLAGRELLVRLGARRLTVHDGGTIVAAHERSVVRGSQTPAARPLPRDPRPQAGCRGGLARPRPGPDGRRLHGGPRGVLAAGAPAGSATPVGPGPWSRSCCSTGACPSSPSTRRSRRRAGSARSIRPSWRSRPAGSPTGGAPRARPSSAPALLRFERRPPSARGL